MPTIGKSSVKVFAGQLRAVDDQAQGLAVAATLTEHRVSLAAGDEELGSWSRSEATVIESIAGVFRLDTGEEEVEFLPAKPVLFRAEILASKREPDGGSAPAAQPSTSFTPTQLFVGAALILAAIVAWSAFGSGDPHDPSDPPDAFMLAVIDTPDNTPSDALVARYELALQRVEGRCILGTASHADIAVRSVQLLNERGIRATALEMLQAAGTSLDVPDVQSLNLQ